MKNQCKESPNTEETWKNILKVSALVGGTLWASKLIADAVVHHNRKDTALQEFEKQDLSWWDREILKSTFKLNDFYVTKFPDTPRMIFPLAVRILYQLIIYHNKMRVDSRLGNLILHNCARLHRIAVSKHIAPINQEWPYWKLVQRETPVQTLWGKITSRRVFFNNSSWNLEDFLNDFEGGLIRFGLFGVKQKRIDVRIYQKDSLGTLINQREIKEKSKNLQFLYHYIKTSNFVVMIYDYLKNWVICKIATILLDNFAHRQVIFSRNEKLMTYSSRISIQKRNLIDLLSKYAIFWQEILCENEKKEKIGTLIIEEMDGTLSEKLRYFQAYLDGNSNVFIANQTPLSSTGREIEHSCCNFINSIFQEWEEHKTDSKYYDNRELSNLAKLKIAIRDGGSCKFCSNNGDPHNPLNNSSENNYNAEFHHIWMVEGPKLRPDHAKVLKYALQESFEPIFGNYDKNGTYLSGNSRKFIPRGPTADWNLILLCDHSTEEICHHPESNYFTYQSFPTKSMVTHNAVDEGQVNNNIVYNLLYWYMYWYAANSIRTDTGKSITIINMNDINRWWVRFSNGKIQLQINGLIKINNDDLKSIFKK